MSAQPPGPTSPPTTGRQTIIEDTPEESFESSFSSGKKVKDFLIFTELKLGASAASFEREIEQSEGALLEESSPDGETSEEIEEDSTLSSTGNEFLDGELTDLHAFFAVETEAIDADCLERQRQQIWIRLTLPLCLRSFDSKRGKESIEEGEFVLSFRLKLTVEQSESEEAHTSHYEILEYQIDDLWPEVTRFESKLSAILTRLTVPSALSMVGVIEEFYLAIEDELNYPDKSVIVRDFFYPVFDARHWGRHPLSPSQSDQKNSNNSVLLMSPSSPTTQASYRARALYDFQALMQGELSFQENDVLQIFANLGNGWLTARKVGDEAASGLIPENYIERL